MASETRSMVKESDSGVVWLDMGSSMSDPLTKRRKLAFLTSGVNSPLLVSGSKIGKLRFLVVVKFFSQ